MKKINPGLKYLEMFHKTAKICKHWDVKDIISILREPGCKG